MFLYTRLGRVSAAVVVACGVGAFGAMGTAGATRVALASAGPIHASKCPASASKKLPGSSITIGSSGALSGPAAVVGQINLGMKAFFAYVNSKGGVKTVAGSKKINLTLLDDQYTSALAESNVHQLVEQDHVPLIGGLVGTAANLAVQPYLNQLCIPQLFAPVGTHYTVSTQYPFTSQMTTHFDYGNAIGRYIVRRFPTATVALIGQSGDLADDYKAGLLAAIKGTKVKLVGFQTYQQTDTNVQSQMTTLEATNASVFVVGNVAAQCTQAITEADQGGWHPTIITGSSCSDPNFIGLPASATQKLYSTEFTKNLATTGDPGVKQFIAASKLAGTPITQTAELGYLVGELIVATLESAKQWTQIGIANAVAELPPNLPKASLIRNGIKLTPGAAKAPIRSFQISPWSQQVQRFASSGPIISAA